VIISCSIAIGVILGVSAIIMVMILGVGVIPVSAAMSVIPSAVLIRSGTVPYSVVVGISAIEISIDNCVQSIVSRACAAPETGHNTMAGGGGCTD